MRLRLAVLLLAAAPLQAQQPGITSIPDSTVAKVDRVFAALGGPSSPGCAVGVGRAGQPVLTRAYGLANLEYGVPNTPETIFESGSVAKQFTATAVQLLAQDGKLSLDDDVRKWIPEVPSFGGRRITIRNLLNHTSGLRDQWGLLDVMGRGPGTQVHSLATTIDLVAHQKSLNFDPGSEYLYSNTGYALAAVIVQRVSGQPLAKFTEERIFRPLAMTHTSWRDDYTRIVKNRATAYAGNPQAGYRTDMPFTNMYGNGGLLTTVGDLLIWNEALDAASPALGGPSFVRTMETPATLTSGRHITYALGLDVTTHDGIREVTHSGSTAGYRTWLARFPTEKLSVAVLCNVSSNPTALGTTVANLFLSRPPTAAQAGGATITLPAAELARYAGTFHEPRSQQLLRTAVRDGKLVTEAPGPSTLVPLGTDRFRIPGRGEVQYEFAGGALRDVLFINDADTTRYLPAARMATSPAQVATFAGSYWSDELETRVTLTARDSTLVIHRRPSFEATIRPLFTDAFGAPEIGTVLFTRDRKGKVDGFEVYAGRVRGLRFAREGKSDKR
jgi:CubicO group peptidase (beta-lactamase class C family)